MKMIVTRVEEFVFLRILKLATDMRSETRRKVILPNFKISLNPPIRMSAVLVRDIAIIAAVGI